MQVGIQHTYMAYCTLNEAEAACHVQSIEKSGGQWKRFCQGKDDAEDVSAKDVIQFVREISSRQKA